MLQLLLTNIDASMARFHSLHHQLKAYFLTMTCLMGLLYIRDLKVYEIGNLESCSTHSLPTYIRVSDNMSRIQSWTSLLKLCISCTVSQSCSPELSLAPVLPPALLWQCYCFSPSLLRVSGSWQLVSITVIPPALSCVRLMVHPRWNNSTELYLPKTPPSRPQ